MGITMLAHDAQQQLISNTGIEAPSLPQDNESRLSIRRAAITNPKLLDGIRRAQREQALLKEIQKPSKLKTQQRRAEFSRQIAKTI